MQHLLWGNLLLFFSPMDGLKWKLDFMKEEQHELLNQFTVVSVGQKGQHLDTHLHAHMQMLAVTWWTVHFLLFS